MSNIVKMQKQLLQQSVTVFQQKWNNHNPKEDQIQFRITPQRHVKGEKISLSLSLESKRGEELLYNNIKSVNLQGRLADEDILTSNLYAGMFVQMLETALLIAVADLERRQQEHEETTRISNPIPN